MTIAFTTRTFDDADLPVLQVIRAAAFAPVFQSFRDIVGPAVAPIAFAAADAEQAQLLADICARDPARVIVAEAEGRIVGFVSWSLDVAPGLGEIGLNAVHPEVAGRGLGAALYSLVLDHMRAAGMRAATVGTGGDPSHAPARRAYEKIGFGSPIPSVSYYMLL